MWERFLNMRALYYCYIYQADLFVISYDCCCSVVSGSLWPHELQHASLPYPRLSLLKLISTESVMPSIYFICLPLLLLPIFLNINVFSNESALCIRWEKYWSFSFNNEWLYRIVPLGLIGLIFLQTKGLSSLLQYHSSKASLLWCSAFFKVQISHLYMATEKP